MNKCLVTKLTYDQIKKARDRQNEDNPTYALQRKFILNWFDDNQPSAGEFVYSIAGVKVCWKAWTLVLGITERRYFMLKRDYQEGRRDPAHGLSGTIKESLQAEACRNFLNTYFSECCDYMPNSPVWHLTSSSRKSDVYKEMKLTLKNMGQPCCSKALFKKIWDTYFRHVKIPKVCRKKQNIFA